MPGLEIDLNLYRTEEELLEALRCGNPDACTCLVKRFASLVYKPAMRILNDADEAEEVLQRTFIKACEKFGTFEERSGLGTWLYRIATNEALMMRRQRQEVNMSFTDAEGVQPDDMPHSLSTWTNDPASAALGSELRDTLETALLELPENLRLVFVLRDMGGLSTEETAETLALGESAVKVRLHRARKRMRELLTDYLAK
jgi:RNA polymerase sigma-70 factor (ECF subfamily)